MLIRLKGVKRYKVRKANGRTYEYAYHRATGKRIVAEIGSSAFVSEIVRIDAAFTRKTATKGTLGSLIRAYRLSPEFAGLAPKTRSDYDRIFDWLSAVDDQPLTDFTAPVVLKIRDKAYRPSENKPRRRYANYVLSVLSLLFAWGRPRGFVRENPVLGIPRIRRSRTEPKKNRAWTDSEIDVVLTAAPDHLKIVIALGAFAGLREGDALRLAWSRYNGKTLQFVSAKRHVPVTLPVHFRLKEILDNALRTSPIIAVNSRGAPWTQSGFRASFFKLLRRLRADGKIGSGLTFHGLRHTVGKALAEAGCDARTIASVLGQQSEAAARIYADEEDRTKRASAAIRKLERRRPQNITSTKNV